VTGGINFQTQDVLIKITSNTNSYPPVHTLFFCKMDKKISVPLLGG